MSIFKDNEDKTEKATPKRTSEARGKGKVAKSRELSTAAILLAALISLEFAGPWIMSSLKIGLRRGMALESPEVADTEWAAGEIRNVLSIVAPSLLPLIVTLIVIALAAGYGQVGFKFTAYPIVPRFEKINPLAGIGRLFNFGQVFTTLLAALKFLLLAGILYFTLGGEITSILLLADVPFSQGAPFVAELAFRILWWIAVPLLAIGIVDLIYQRWQHQKDLRMAKQEVKDERKMTEGDPEIKARIKRAQRELARRRMMTEVPKADVIITNPTRYAVALKYERERMSAPMVTAKGTDELALKIREIARRHRVPIMEDPPLARTLYSAVKIGMEIPPRFYQAVATVLSHVLRLRPEAV
ncbi:MAG: flagellar biosynthesis protein FlhB [Planctomycetota bacterium]